LSKVIRFGTNNVGMSGNPSRSVDEAVSPMARQGSRESRFINKPGDLKAEETIEGSTKNGEMHKFWNEDQVHRILVQ
jgi:hypothetical protein